ncbi:MAG TPA: hypothetical protein VJS64_13425 [Pyrinomonadaceae bacterium]|nr:hypothetical protein [Pyrinomonadaceae bacterium]
MKSKHLTRYALLFAGAVLLVLLLAAPGLAQCAMCRASLTGSNNAFFIRNFNIGVLVLLTPPVAIFCSIFIILKRHHGAGEQQSEDNEK